MADNLNSIWSFLGKILLLSVAISVAIKEGGPLLPLPITNGVALTIVLCPTLIMSVVLAFRANR